MQIMALPPWRWGERRVRTARPHAPCDADPRHKHVRTRDAVLHAFPHDKAACVARRIASRVFYRGDTTHDAPRVHARVGRRVPDVSVSPTSRSTASYGLSHHTL